MEFEKVSRSDTNKTLEYVANKLNRLYTLPPMPETAVKIMHLSSDPDADASQLAVIIERDPSLAAQILRYARSALFSYRGELTCVKDAVTRVLGFERVSQIAFGLSTVKSFNIPGEGPLGLQQFWKHSLYCAVLTQALSILADPKLELNEREGFLVGLLHNFGILLIGHLMPEEFKQISELREKDADLSMAEIEKRVFFQDGEPESLVMGHGSIGAILLKLWEMPSSVITVAGTHQILTYRGEHQKYVELVQLANALLSEQRIGDEPCLQNPSDLMTGLGIKEEQARALLDTLLEQCQSLDEMISKMAA